MNSISITDIIDNYKEQVDLYYHMLGLARQQLELAENKLPVDDILAERHRLMEKICSLNGQNQVWQDCFCQSKGIDTFNLSGIRSIETADKVEELSQILEEITQVLQQIEAVDNSIQEMLNQQLSHRNRPRTTPQQAQQAYLKGTKPQA